LEAARKEIAAASQAGDHVAVAAEIQRWVDLDLALTDPLGMFMDIDPGGYNYGDTVLWNIDYGMVAYVLRPGAGAIRTEVDYGQVIPLPIQIQAAPTWFKPDMDAGNIASLDRIAFKVDQALLKQRIYWGWSLLVDSVAVGSAQYTGIGGTEVTAASLNNAITQVGDVADGVRCIVGRKTALAPIFDFGGFDWQTERDIMLTGGIGVYRGVPLVGLRSVRDEWGLRRRGAALIDDDDIMVVGNNVGRIAFSDVVVDDLGIDERRYITTLHTQHMIGATLYPDRLWRIQTL
jgi:hypothetical protein